MIKPPGSTPFARAAAKSFREAGQARAWLFLKQNGQVGRRPDFDADVPLLAGFKKAMGFVF